MVVGRRPPFLAPRRRIALTKRGVVPRPARKAFRAEYAGDPRSSPARHLTLREPPSGLLADDQVSAHPGTTAFATFLDGSGAGPGVDATKFGCHPSGVGRRLIGRSMSPAQGRKGPSWGGARIDSKGNVTCGSAYPSFSAEACGKDRGSAAPICHLPPRRRRAKVTGERSRSPHVAARHIWRCRQA